MADDLKDLGTTTLFRASINWREMPKYDYSFSRRVLGFDGTTQQVIQLAPEKPQQLDFKAGFFSKQDEKDFLTKFVSFKGRLARFWLLLPFNMFQLVGSAGIGSTTLTVERNNFEYQGFERFYILLTNGDLITRKITSTSVNETLGTLDLNFSDGTDRILNPSSIVLFSLCLLVRFDMDSLNLEHRTAYVSEADVKVIELVKEYSLA